MPERKEKGTLIGADLDVADANRIVRKLVDTQEAGTGFMGKKCTIVAE
jgi:hypothetical protein